MAADLASFDLDATMRYVNVPCSYLVVLPHATSYSCYPFSAPHPFGSYLVVLPHTLRWSTLLRRASRWAGSSVAR